MLVAGVREQLKIIPKYVGRLPRIMIIMVLY
jgi:hypothetical protein